MNKKTTGHMQNQGNRIWKKTRHLRQTGAVETFAAVELKIHAVRSRKLWFCFNKDNSQFYSGYPPARV
ncbi:MAG: hypothetical protein QMD09_11700 [Desulfatibacillaceae bacterium]|nr:hypothetical protein [Desulfatibacillaceae bacterium]